MGTEVLRPQDCLVERFSGFHGRRNGIIHGYPKPSLVRTDHKKRYQNHNHQHQQQKESTIPNRTPSSDDSRHETHRNELKTGKVSIFMRGDSLDSLNSRMKKDGSKKTVLKQGDVYAGSACSVSPSPSSLPLPSFFKKQDFKSFDDSATRDLRRLLRLE